jgi:leader peptidase (prepilin peptidase)/N-methyltransferase
VTFPPGAGAAVSFILGLLFGSFANVCIHRIPSGESVVTPRSRCPGCGVLIRWYDNVPLLSWLLLRGRCRGCGAAISWTYPLVEAAMGGGFLASYLLYGISLDGAAAAWLTFSCVVLWVIDSRHFILPDLLTLTGIAAGILFAAARGISALAAGDGVAGAGLFLGGPLDHPVRLLASLGGAAAGAAIPLLARGGYMLSRRLRGGPAGVEGDEGGVAVEEADTGGGEVAEAALAEGMGLGDVKMLAMVGAFLGPRLVLVTLLAGSITGCLLVIPWLLLTGRGFRTPVPFGPFLSFGALLALFAGEGLAAAYARLVAGLLG